MFDGRPPSFNSCVKVGGKAVILSGSEVRDGAFEGEFDDYPVCVIGSIVYIYGDKLIRETRFIWEWDKTKNTFEPGNERELSYED